MPTLVLLQHGPTRLWTCQTRELFLGTTESCGSLTWSRKRVFLLGPSHHYYLTGCALSKCDTYETPLGNLKVDTETVAELHKKAKFDKMSVSQDEDEHSLEMHLPYIYKMLSR